jgi:hypothetical protein
VFRALDPMFLWWSGANAMTASVCAGADSPIPKENTQKPTAMSGYGVEVPTRNTRPVAERVIPVASPARGPNAVTRRALKTVETSVAAVSIVVRIDHEY